MPSICLNMIVKNESQVIVETLNNLTKYINFDYWVISDTGSTDGTQQLIKDYFKNKNIPGELVSHEWKDFGYNRSKALECAYNKTDYLLIFDADDKIHGDFKLPFSTLNDKYSDRYKMRFGKGFEYMRPLLINNRKRWMFKGVLHEFLANLESVNNDSTITGDYYIESGRTGDRSKNPNKYIDDAIILKNAYEKEQDTLLASRYAFYCARSYKDAGEKYHNDAIIWYKKILDNNNHWNQERYYAALELGNIYKLHNNMEESLKYLLKTLECDNERIEGLIIAIDYLYYKECYFFINTLYHKHKDYTTYDLSNKLFINKFYYQDKLEYFNSITAHRVNDKESGYICCKKILINQTIGMNEILSTIDNIFYYRENLEKDRDTITLFKAIDDIVYKNNNNNSIELWNILFNKNKDKFIAKNKSIIKKIIRTVNSSVNKNIMITFTTCKRFDLFKETINSILNQWTDVDKINYWFCVDDNSTEEDRNNMKSSYNWIEYYMKSPSEKGHRASMNIIWNKLNELKPEYWIHMEDDFLFFHQTNYITKAIEVLKGKGDIKQVVFNRNYAETIKHYSVIGHLPSDVPGIVLHDYCPNETKNYRNSQYWPHYSFRPSVTDVHTVLTLGNFDSPNQFFEKDYAERWSSSNYKTAFFDRITHIHTGKITTDISGNVKNAYTLNNEVQFNIHIKVVNLERRPDRKQNTKKELNNNGFNDTDFVFFKAIDGKEVVPTQELKQLFDGNNFNNMKGVIGCALSHLKIWKELIADKVNNYYVILEDDTTLVEGCKEILNKLTNEFQSKDLIMLGYHMWENARNQVKGIYDVKSTIEIKPLNRNLYIGGTFSYSINKNGANKIINYIERNGIKKAIDTTIKDTDNLHIYELQPHIIHSDWCVPGQPPIDTDIQRNFEKLNFDKLIEDKFIFYPYKDQIGNDIYFHDKLSVYEYMLIADKDKDCVGFNTLGFFKNKIEYLSGSKYFGEKDGIYIKK